MTLPQLYSLMEVHVGINQHENKNPTEKLNDDQVYGIESFDWHEKFQFTSNVIINDIAILKLSRAVNLDRPQVSYEICLF